MEKKVTYLIILTFLFTTKIFAQNQIETKHHYHYSSDSVLYWDLDTKLYWWISTSPTDNSQDVLLKSETMPQYSNPMYLDMEGYNTLRTEFAANPKTNQRLNKQIIFEVHADGSNPISKNEFIEATKFTSDSKTYYGKGLEAKVTATDLYSGVENIFYSVNKAEYKKYEAPVEIEKEGENIFKYYALDNCGNTEKAHEATVYLDLTAPTTTKKVVGNLIGDVLSQDAKIALESIDNLSGVKATYYSIDGAAAKVYSSPLPALMFFDGKHKISFYAIDNVGNSNVNNFGNGTESQFSYEFIIDKNGPTALMKIEGDKFEGSKTFVSTRSKFSIEADDDYSEVKEIKYGLNVPANQIYTTPTAFAASQGTVLLNYHSEDKLGNTGKLYNTTVFVDATEPTSFIDYGEPQFFSRDTLFINKETLIKITSSDAESGLTKTEYSIDDAAFSKYSTQFKIEKSGYHKIGFKATDNVNNIEQTKYSYVTVDNEAPEIFINFSIEPIRQETKDGKSYDVYPQYTKMYFSATDRSTGEQDIFYSINNSVLTKYESAKKINDAGLISKEQFYTIKVVAKDKLGNESEKSISFFIAKK